LQVQVLLLEPGLLLLYKHPFGNVQDHGARVLPVRLGLGIPLNSDGTAVVFAAEFDHEAACARALTN
jgi:hypothetical protein